MEIFGGYLVSLIELDVHQLYDPTNFCVVAIFWVYSAYGGVDLP